MLNVDLTSLIETELPDLTVVLLPVLLILLMLFLVLILFNVSLHILYLYLLLGAHDSLDGTASSLYSFEQVR